MNEQQTTRRRAAPRPRSVNEEAKRGAAVRKHRETTTMAAAAAVSPDKPLTDKQKAFIRSWAEGNSIPVALQRAGFSVKDNSLGYRLAKMPNVLKLYNEEKAKFEEAAQMTRKKVMDGLIEAVEMAKLMAEPATMVSGWREIGKMCGYYEPKKVQVDVSVTGNIVHERLNRLTDAELLKIIQGQGPEGAAHVLTGPESDDSEDAGAD